MKKTFAFFVLAGLLSGCATTDWGKPIIPTVPPPKPNTETKTTARGDGIKSKADVDKKDAAPGKETATNEPKPRGPVTVGQVTDRNAKEMLKALETELEQDAANGAAKP